MKGKHAGVFGGTGRRSSSSTATEKPGITRPAAPGFKEWGEAWWLLTAIRVSV